MSMLNIYRWRTTLVILFVIFLMIYAIFHFSAHREVPTYGLQIQPKDQPITSKPKQKTVFNFSAQREDPTYRLKIQSTEQPITSEPKQKKRTLEATVELPIIVTAASSNHYLESVEMLNSLAAVVRSAYPTIPVYYYDLGLELDQKIEVKKICNCTVLDFPFDKFPGHVRRLKAYCWKPLIIKRMLQISQFVMWMDASVQFKTSKLDDLFTQAKQYGVLMYHNQFSLPAHVHRDTFTFLEESPCLFKDFTEYHAGLILIHSGNSVVKNYIIDPWVKCALIEDCMKTKNNEMEIISCPSHSKFHTCHRFDQAILSILIFRLFHSSYRNHDIDMGRYFKICYDQSCRKT